MVLEGVHSPHPSLYRDPFITTTPPHHSISLLPLHGHHPNTIEDTDVRSVYVWTRRYCLNSTLSKQDKPDDSNLNMDRFNCTRKELANTTSSVNGSTKRGTIVQARAASLSIWWLWQIGFNCLKRIQIAVVAAPRAMSRSCFVGTRGVPSGHTNRPAVLI